MTDTRPVVNKLPPVILPATDKIPPVNKLPPLTLPVAVTNPVVNKLPPVTLPVTDKFPPVSKFPPVILLVAETEFKLSVLLHVLELLVPKVKTEFTVPGPKLGSACSRPKNS